MKHNILITADLTWGDIFECCFKAQSSKLERLFWHVSVKRDRSSFELWALKELSNMTPHVGLALQACSATVRFLHCWAAPGRGLHDKIWSPFENGHLIVFRFEFLHQQYFRFLLFSGSRNYHIVNLNSRKDSWYHDYWVYIGCHSYISARVAGIRRKPLNASQVYWWTNYKSNYRRISECFILVRNHSEKAVSQMSKSLPESGFLCILNRILNPHHHLKTHWRPAPPICLFWDDI